MVITISRRDFKALLKQAQREQEAEDRGYSCHAAYVLAHRQSRRDALLARRDSVRAHNREQMI
jgi:hypothetical protein